jgi:hypothetical protein
MCAGGTDRAILIQRGLDGVSGSAKSKAIKYYNDSIDLSRKHLKEERRVLIQALGIVARVN